MILSHSKKFVFIRIPKTASISMKTVLMPFRNTKSYSTRCGISWVKRKIDDKIWERYFIFAFVRNPWDRVISDYFYFMNYHERKKKKCDWHGNFEKFIYDSWLVRKRWQVQLRWLKNGDGKIDINFIGRFENIQKDFNYVKNKLGIIADLPHRNKTDHKPYWKYYNDKLIELIYENCKEDIEYFGYKFRK